MARREKEEPIMAALLSGSYAFCLAEIISKLNSKCLMYLLQDFIGSFPSFGCLGLRAPGGYIKCQQVHSNKPMSGAGSPNCRPGSVQSLRQGDEEVNKRKK